MRLPGGYENFGKILEKGFDFVDKSLLIQAIIDDPNEVIVITRPRRFGKTLNLSMLQHFFAAEVYGLKTKTLFDKLKITALGDSCLQHQGKYPVIYISFKEVRDHSFAHALEMLGYLFAEVYAEHRYLLDSPKLAPEDKQFFSSILAITRDQAKLERALRNLTYYLFQHHGTRPWLLIDEYDTPMQSAFVGGYYQEIIALFRGMFGAALKTNPYLEKAVITGILRIAKESLFSGLNNVKVYTVLNSDYSEYFGFTEFEVENLLQRGNLSSHATDIRRWYNGYLVGDTVIYNPWSIVNCINDRGSLRPYWVNTSSNDLIKRQLARGDAALKRDLAKLLHNDPISASIDENLVFADLDNNNNALWSLLLFSGYLKALHAESSEMDTHTDAQLIAPNQEVLLLYRGIIYGWFSDKLGTSRYQNFLKNLIEGNIEAFSQELQDCLESTLSLFDVTGRHPEKFYHGFVLGLMVALQETHEVQSNKEGGQGRYDVMLIPKDPSQLGIVLEFKTADSEKQLAGTAEQALQQIRDRDYAAMLHSKGVTHIMQMGLAFYHKKVLMAWSKIGS